MLVVFSTLFSFAVLEILARVYLVNFAPDTFFNKYASIDQLNERYGAPRFVPHRYLGFYPTPNYSVGTNRHNSLGYRGEEIAIPKPEGLFRIVCIGGSTTYGAGVEDYRETYPYLLQQELNQAGYENVEVVNAGAFSYSSAESLINFQFRILDLEPDLIIVYDNVNDIPPRLVWPHKFYMADSSHFETRRIEFQPPFWEGSALIRMLLVRANLTESHGSLRRNYIESRGSYYGGLFQLQLAQGTYPTGYLARVSIQKMLDENPPIYFERNLRNLVALAHSYNVEVVLLTFAFNPQKQGTDVHYTSEEYQFAYLQQNDVIRLVAEATGAHLYDFWAEMPLNDEYFADGIHFSGLGEVVHANLIAQYLIENNLVPGSEGRAP